MSRVAIICLGAYGDICNALPIALHEFQHGNHVTFYVSRPYAEILDGVSYVEKFVWTGHYSECIQARDYAEQSGLYDSVLVAQCYGSSVERQTDSFCKEAWRIVGMLPHWDKIPLWFDNRSCQREFGLYSGVRRDYGNKPILLVNHNGKSSPFQSKVELLGLIDQVKAAFAVVDISNYQCERFYDLLGLFEEARCLITTDSGPLHLAQAVPSLPVIALVTDKPDHWHGSPPRSNHLLRIRYGDFPTKAAMERILEALVYVTTKQAPRRIIHAWNDYPYRQPDAQHRHSIAKLSWEKEYAKGKWVSCPVPDAQLTRNATSIPGESKPLPFINDIIRAACDQARPEDVICLTNDDTIFVDGLTERIFPSYVPFWSSRWEHAAVRGPLDSTMIKHKSWKHVGADIFCFTKKWWMEWGNEFPDMIVAREAWDLVLRTLINLRGGHEEDALCAHIIHAPEWHSAQYRECSSNLFNRESARAFFRNHQMPWPQV